MTDSSTTPNLEEALEEPLENNLPLVNYIMLHRIYDMLALIARGITQDDSVDKLISYHEQGYLLGPSPSYMDDKNGNE